MYDPGKLRRNKKGKHPPSFAERLRRKMLVVALSPGDWSGARARTAAARATAGSIGRSPAAGKQQRKAGRTWKSILQSAPIISPHHRPLSQRERGVWSRWKTW